MLILDAHVHVYPFYDEGVLLKSAVENLSRLATAEDQIGIALTEREGVNVFGKWADGKVPDGWTVEQKEEPTLLLTSPEGKSLLVFAGRQIACREKVEILGIGTQVPVPDGVPCESAIISIENDDGIPILSWGVGKWVFPRSMVVKRLLEDYPVAELVVCDTSLRPTFWPQPKCMRDGYLPVLCGSDPLPQPGEEVQAGRYACGIRMEWPVEDPARALIGGIRLGFLEARGTRNSFREFWKRH